jgi:hypothetical protein
MLICRWPSKWQIAWIDSPRREQAALVGEGKVATGAGDKAMTSPA